MFLKRMAAKIGIGAAKIDTVLEKAVYQPGDTVKGTVTIKGGNIDQETKFVKIKVVQRYDIEQDDDQVTKYTNIVVHHVTDAFTIKANETYNFPFAFHLPLDTPVTMGKTTTELVTDLDLQGAIDKADYDPIQVTVHPWISQILKAIDILGFDLIEVDCKDARNLKRRLPFIQEFEFVPVTGPFYGLLDELEVMFFINEKGVEMHVEIDRKARGIMGWLDEMITEGERNAAIRFEGDQLIGDIDWIADELEIFISQYGDL
ncbi:sporulation protein [Bacillus sp. NPDC093026]|uniref:sporulation protein n=1 Tax=Bacillus sp. NPDC093026 TaxID=3363948 RepID=UPI0037FFD86F